jgi:signal recognition particle GTPase
VKHLEKENIQLKTSLDEANIIKEDLKILNDRLENDLKATRNEKQILEGKVLTLEAKSIPVQIMNDYELLKKENESLKKENSFLKRMVDKVLNYANSKIKDLINFGKPQVKQSVSFEDFSSQIIVEDMASKAAGYSKEDLLETVKRLQDDAQAYEDAKKDLKELLQREENQNQSQSILKP